MRAAQAGDRAAFGKLALLLEPRGRAFARALVGSDEDAVDWEYVDDELQPPAHLAADEGARAFWRALGRLSTRDREILALRHFEELSYARLAERLRIPEGTVMSRLFHARRRLRAALPPELAEELRR